MLAHRNTHNVRYQTLDSCSSPSNHISDPSWKLLVIKDFLGGFLERMVVLFLGTDSYPTVPDFQIEYEAGSILDFIYFQQIQLEDKN